MSNDTIKYDHLDIKYYTIDEYSLALFEEKFSKEVVEEIKKHDDFDFYSREKIIKLSEEEKFQDELNRHIKNLLEARQEGNETGECISRDFIIELRVHLHKGTKPTTGFKDSEVV